MAEKLLVQIDKNVQYLLCEDFLLPYNFRGYYFSRIGKFAKIITREISEIKKFAKISIREN